MRHTVLAVDEAGPDRLLIWHETAPHQAQNYPGAFRVGSFGFGRTSELPGTGPGQLACPAPLCGASAGQ